MKTIKTNSLSLSVLFLITISLNACRISKLTDSSKDRKTSSKTTNSISTEEHHTNYTRSRSIVDSSRQLYHVTIFPADTFFQFSPEDGFRGKASKIELRASISQLRHIRDSALFTGSRQGVTKEKGMKKVESSQFSRSKSVEKSKANGWWLCLAAAVVVIGVGIFKWSRKRYF